MKKKADTNPNAKEIERLEKKGRPKGVPYGNPDLKDMTPNPKVRSGKMAKTLVKLRTRK